MRILVTGGHGQLSRDLVRNDAHEVVAVGRERLDITDPSAIRRALAAIRPDAVINTAAFHKVDLCESEPEQSFLVNAAAPQRLAAACQEAAITLLHISTDYVFDGTRSTPYPESEPRRPLSVYGASKAAGEMAVLATSPRALVVRTTGLYGVGGQKTRQGNFVETMLRLAASGNPVTVVADQVLTPSATTDVAAMMVALLESGAHGLVHATNSGQCSWYDFAAEIFRLSGLSVDLRPATQAERPLPARRPAYSVLAHDRLHSLGLPSPRPWQEALAQYLHDRAKGAI